MTFGFVCLQALQRLDDRGVVRRGAGALHPAGPHPHVGPGSRRQGDGAVCRQGGHRLRLLREPGTPRTPDDPRQGPLLGPGDGRGVRPRDGVLHARRLVVASPADRPGLAVHGQPRLGRRAHFGRDAVVALQRHVHPLPRPEDRAVGGGDRLDALLPRARRAGPRQAALLGAAGRAVHGARRRPMWT